MCFRYSHFCSTVSLHADQCTEGQKRSKSSETLPSDGVDVEQLQRSIFRKQLSDHHSI